MVGGKYIKTCIDLTDSYMAVSIHTGNRNEIQVWQLGQKLKISSFELDSEDQISVMTWSQLVLPLNSTKRTRSDSQKTHKLQSSYLIVGLELGDILVFSPFSKDIVNKIPNDTKTISMFASNNEEFYTLDLLSQIKKFPILGNKATNSFAFTDDKAVKLIFQHLGDDDLIVTSNSLHILEPTNDGYLESSLRLPVPRGHTSQINCVIQSTLDTDLIATSRDSDNTIHIYLKKQNISILKSSSSITSLKFIILNEREYLALFLQDGAIEIFQDFSTKRLKTDEVSPFIAITSDTTLENIFVNEQNDLLCVWFQDMKTNFSKIDISLPKFHIETIKQNGAQDKPVVEDDEDEDEDSEPKTSENEESNQFIVLTSDELYSLLAPLIDNDDTKLIEICNANNSDINIKQTMLKNITLDQSIVLFKTLALRISEQPSDSSNLSKWLKYLLLIHGNNVIKSDENVAFLKLIRASLLESTKHLPNLVALQGRLLLLKSQLQLRNELESLDLEESDEESDIDVEEEEQDNVNDPNEPSFYVNGEGDEDTVLSDNNDLPEDEDDDDED